MRSATEIGEPKKNILQISTNHLLETSAWNIFSYSNYSMASIYLLIVDLSSQFGK